MLKSFAFLALLSAIPLLTQNAPRSVALSNRSNVSTADIQEAFDRECPNITLTVDSSKSEFTLEVRKKTNDKGVARDGYDLTVFDQDGKVFHKSSNPYLKNAVENVCRAINASPKKK